MSDRKPTRSELFREGLKPLQGIADALEYAEWCEREMKRLAKALHTAKAEKELMRSEKEKLRFALMNAERASPLNKNDEAMLSTYGVTLEFTRKATSGKLIRARGKGRTLARVDGEETESILGDLMHELRKEIRGEPARV